MEQSLWVLVMVGVFVAIIVYNLRNGTKLADVAMATDEQTLLDLRNVHVRGTLKPKRKLSWSNQRVLVTTKRLFILIPGDEAWVQYEIELVESSDAQAQRIGRFFLAHRKSALLKEGSVGLRIHGQFVETHMGVPTSLSFETTNATELFNSIVGAA